jgi:hypothetical protein
MTSENIIGESEPSAILTLYVAALPTKPDEPTESMIFNVESGITYASQIGIQVNWTAPADNGAPILGYQLYMAEEESPQVLIYDGSKTSRPDIKSITITEGITKSLVYKFRVVAISAVG